MNFRPAIVAIISAFLMFAAHRALKIQYHRQCTGDLFRVILFSQSSMCSHIDSILRIIELSTDQAAKLATTYAIEFLTGFIKLSAGGGGGLSSSSRLFV